MKIQRIVVGELEENCYILDIDGQVLVIDPGDEFSKIKDAIGNRKVLKILITHQHFDHIGALYDIMEVYKVEKLDFQSLEEQEYTIGPFTFQVLHTPGHSSDSISYYFPKDGCMFVGDFVFQGTIGRCDLATGDFSIMKKSIKKLLKYPDSTILYPGHGFSTTILKENQENPYF